MQKPFKALTWILNFNISIRMKQNTVIAVQCTIPTLKFDNFYIFCLLSRSAHWMCIIYFQFANITATVICTEILRNRNQPAGDSK